ncbi:hypothetical protein LVJ94_27490 [Pendulispora rubella]|uniref:Uncharacterized protein n=1 Tax=Pendulispora rubella TaxID=2741070 RepID=A0ABZ2KRH3_9BACT
MGCTARYLDVQESEHRERDVGNLAEWLRPFDQGRTKFGSPTGWRASAGRGAALAARDAAWLTYLG